MKIWVIVERWGKLTVREFTKNQRWIPNGSLEKSFISQGNFFKSKAKAQAVLNKILKFISRGRML